MPKLNYRHPHNPAHAPDHILSSIIGLMCLSLWLKANYYSEHGNVSLLASNVDGTAKREKWC